MREKGVPQPFLSEWFRRGTGQNFAESGLCLIIFDDAAGSPKIIADRVRDQLDESLTIAQNFRFKGVRKDGIGNDQRQDRWHPSCQKNGDDDVEALVTASPTTLEPGLDLHALRSVFPLSLFGEFAAEATLDLLGLRLAVVRLLDRDIQRVRLIVDHSYISCGRATRICHQPAPDRLYSRPDLREKGHLTQFGRQGF